MLNCVQSFANRSSRRWKGTAHRTSPTMSCAYASRQLIVLDRRDPSPRCLSMSYPRCLQLRRSATRDCSLPGRLFPGVLCITVVVVDCFWIVGILLLGAYQRRCLVHRYLLLTMEMRWLQM